MSRMDRLGAALESLTDTPVSRKQFIGGAIAGALVVAARFPVSDAAAATAGGQVSAWVVVGADETVTIVCPAAEMGQGTSTSLPQIVADELGVSWSNVRMTLADADPRFVNPMFGSQVTGGSTAIRGYYESLRTAGATARELLVYAASQSAAPLGGGAQGDYTVQAGVVKNTVSGATATFGQLADAAGKLTLPSDWAVTSRPTGVVGQAVQRLDIPAKVNGSAVFGLDVRRPGMVYAAVRLAPKVGQTLGTVGAVPTGVQVVQLKNDAGKKIGIAAVVSDSNWSAIKAVRALTVSWVDAPYTAATDTATMKANAQSLMTSGPALVAKDVGGAKTAIAAASKQLAATYWAPYLAHATMEPMNATAQVVAGTSCEIWAPTQNQSGSVLAAKALTGLSEAQIKVHTTFLGGGLGRKAETDYVSQAVQVAMATAGKPVKLIWPREEDFAHDFYRPASLCNFTAGLDATGKPVGITSRTVSQSLFGVRGWLAPDWVDPSAVEGLVLNGDQDTVAYSLGNSQLVEWVNDTTANVPVGFWRSVGHSYNTFFIESFIDEMAKAAGKDPVAFRTAMLPAGSRELAVLQRLVTESSWSTKVSGVGKGVALSRSFGGAIVGQVIEVSGSLPSSIKVNKVTAVIDCGLVINPDTVKAQVESAVLQGLAAAMWQDMPFTLGTPARKNFNTYRMAKLSETPTINVVIMPANGNPPTGVGEPGVPATAPAIGNAIAALTGTRLRSLPFVPQAVPIV